MSSRSSRRLRLQHDKEGDKEDDKESSVVAAPENQVPSKRGGDVIRGNPDIIERVQFDLGPSFTPSTFICSAPIQTAKSDNNAAADNNAIANSKAQWRFKTRQQTYGSIEATLKIRGVGGTSQQITHQILFDKNLEHMKVPVHHFALQVWSY